MKIPTVGSCCCNNLITAGNILGWLGVVLGALYIICGFPNPKILVQGFVALALYICWLYGIENSRPGYLLPIVIISFISTLLFSIGAILSLFLLIYVKLFSDKPMPEIQGIPLTIFIPILCLVAVIDSYFCILKYSIYKSVKQRSENIGQRNSQDVV